MCQIFKRFRITLESFIVFFSFGTILILFISIPPFALMNLQNRNIFSHQTSHTCGPLPIVVHLIFFEPIRITILDLEPNPDFKILFNISEMNDRIFNCNISNHRSGDVLPFIFFELRAPTCLSGRYDPTTGNFTHFTYISSTSTPFQEHFTPLYRGTPVLHFIFWLLRCTL